MQRSNWKIKSYSALCALEEFVINGINADYEDFGNKEDVSPETVCDYGCGNMLFTPHNSTKEILDKYCISEYEYNKICEELTAVLSLGECGWCV